MKLVSRPHFSLLHRVARNVLLPVGKIKDHIQKTIGAGAVSTVLDLGSGMLYWSRWFAARYNCAVYAVDTYYAISPPHEIMYGKGIFCYADFNRCLDNVPAFDIAWLCDVLHHLPPHICEDYLRKVA